LNKHDDVVELNFMKNWLRPCYNTVHIKQLNQPCERIHKQANMCCVKVFFCVGLWPMSLQSDLTSG